MSKPIIAIPMGDPAGVGPEIVVKSLNNRETYAVARPLAIGDAGVLKQAMTFCGMSLEINRVEGPGAGRYTHGTMDVIDLANVDISEMKIGRVQASCGSAAFEYVRKATELAMTRQVDAMATTPINKESLKAAKVPYIGHTEILQDLSKTENALTMFQVFDLRVFFFTRHVSLKRAIELIRKDSIYRFIHRCVDALGVLGVKEPRLAVAGLNPHGGEHGLFGDEEVKEIEPAVMRAKADGMDIVGPVPADSVFHFALKGRYDAVLSLYHDQGHIAAKMVDFERTIAITNGMPFLRTSVDHGTAFDIAGTGKVSEVGMMEAIRLAALYAPKFKRLAGIFG